MTFGPSLASLLLTLMAALLAGVVLRTTGRLPADAVLVLNRVIVDVTLPAMIIGILCDSELHPAIWGALLATAAGQVVGMMGGIGLARGLGLPRRTQGAAGLVAAFANTGFLGIPVAYALFDGKGVGPSTAILVDSFNTTVLLWTSGLVLARRMGDATAQPRSMADALLTPLTASVVLGLALNLAHVAPPPLVRKALDRIGAATTALVFLSLGLSLDLAALRGRVRAILLVSGTKLALAPLAAFAAVYLVHLPHTVGMVAVMQSAMPTSLLSVVLATEAGCDGAFAAGVAVVTTVLATVALPIVIRLVETCLP